MDPFARPVRRVCDASTSSLLHRHVFDSVDVRPVAATTSRSAGSSSRLSRRWRLPHESPAQDDLVSLWKDARIDQNWRSWSCSTCAKLGGLAMACATHTAAYCALGSMLVVMPESQTYGVLEDQHVQAAAAGCKWPYFVVCQPVSPEMNEHKQSVVLLWMSGVRSSMHSHDGCGCGERTAATSKSTSLSSLGACCE